MKRTSRIVWFGAVVGVLAVTGAVSLFFPRMKPCSRKNDVSFSEFNAALSSLEIVYGYEVRIFTFATLDSRHHNTVHNEAGRFFGLASEACWESLQSVSDIPRRGKYTGFQVEFNAMTGHVPGKIRFSTFADESGSCCIMQSDEKYSISNSSDGARLTKSLMNFCSTLMALQEDDGPLE